MFERIWIGHKTEGRGLRLHEDYLVEVPILEKTLWGNEKLGEFGIIKAKRQILVQYDIAKVLSVVLGAQIYNQMYKSGELDEIFERKVKVIASPCVTHTPFPNLSQEEADAIEWIKCPFELEPKPRIDKPAANLY
jgi:hypothetical protein